MGGVPNLKLRQGGGQTLILIVPVLSQLCTLYLVQYYSLCRPISPHSQACSDSGSAQFARWEISR